VRWITYRHADADADRVGVVVGGSVHGLPEGETLHGLLEGEGLARAGQRAGTEPAEVVEVASVRLRPPLRNPPAIRDFYAFEQHVATARRARGLDVPPEWFEFPVFYFSSPHVVLGPGDQVSAPPGSEALDFELEVAAVVGREGSDLTPEQALRHIAGLTIMNDWSARDLQRREMAVGLGPAKGKDFATSLGPQLVTPDELELRRDGHHWDLAMTARVRRAGEEEQVQTRGSLADLHWSFADMVAQASRGSRVVPGDVIGSGTVGGGGLLELGLTEGEEAHPWLQPGDEVILEVELLGALTSRVGHP
jgi:2-keto-4-pentenoate hydratase/2-oxohepta-3-ene-1,7-dioic acid hydratase in catechol pathway